MRFGEDFLSDRDMSPPLIQSDLLNSVEPESPVAPGFGEGAGPTVVTLDDRNEGIPEADMDIQAELEAEANLEASAPSSTIKKRGRPSLSGSATPAKSVTSKTPRSTKSTAAPKSAGRSTGKRKGAEVEAEAEAEDEDEEVVSTPAPKRGRPGRAAGASASARLAAKAANKPTRGRPKSTAAAAKPAKKAGRPAKATNGTPAADEYEVEDIVDSAIDAETMEHMYLVKWKNYPASESTWEPKKNFKGSLDLVRKFDAKKKKKEEAAEAAKKAAAKKIESAAAAASGEEKTATRGRKARLPRLSRPLRRLRGGRGGRGELGPD